MIRQGFVSNSSSSSFIIQVPKEKLEFDQILDYYKVNKELSPRFRAWLNLILDYILEKAVKKDDYDDDYDDDDDYYDSEGEVTKVHNIPYILEDFYKEFFKDRFPHGDLTEEEFEAIRLKALESFKDNSWFSYYIRDYSYGRGYSYDDLNIPYSISTEIMENCYNIFTDPSVAMVQRD